LTKINFTYLLHISKALKLIYIHVEFPKFSRDDAQDYASRAGEGNRKGEGREVDKGKEEEEEGE